MEANSLGFEKNHVRLEAAAKRMVVEQAAPIARDGPAIWDLVIEDMEARDQVGRERYGTPLQAHNGRKPLTDAYQEALDLVAYLRQEIQERQAPQITEAFLDLDGILVDFHGGALRAHGADARCLIPGEWHLDKCLKLHPAAFWAKCCGHDFWATLGPLRDAASIVQLVESHVRKESLWLLSSPSDDPGSCSGKYSWVSRCMPSYSRKLILATSKRPIARPGALLIDDSPANVQGWQEAGGEAILLPRPWNHLHEYQDLTVDYLKHALGAMKERLPG